jgi:molybdopterin-guanine dinucleotide biosynthesis protein A
MSERLPVHGFVLAGGKSSRMGEDKALLRFLGRPMVEIAVEKLRGFCEVVTIAGNREDLGGFAPVVRETRVDVGPAAGIEAGLRAAAQPWAMFLPVDVPLIPEELLRRWAEAVVEEGADGCGVSYLLVLGERQPAFCMLRRDYAAQVSKAIEAGERKLAEMWTGLDDDGRSGWLWACDAARFAPMEAPTKLEIGHWFSNVNTPQELAEAEAWAREGGLGGV